MQAPSGKPLGKRILFKLLPKKQKTSGGIILADTSSTPLVEAEVILIGPDVTTIKQGDKILVPGGSGVEHELDGIKYFFIDEHAPFYILP